MKKRSKILSALIAFVLVIVCMSVLLVSCTDDKKEPTPDPNPGTEQQGGNEKPDGGNQGGNEKPDGGDQGGNTDPEPEKPYIPSVDDSIGNIAFAIANTYIFDGKALGWDVDLAAGGDLLGGKINIASAGRLDPKERDNNKFSFVLTLADNNTLEFYADADKLYTDAKVGGSSRGAKVIRSFHLGDAVKDLTVPTVTADDIMGNEIFAILTMAGTMAFGNSKVTYTNENGVQTYALAGTLEYLVDFAKGALGPNLPAELIPVLDMLAPLHVSLNGVTEGATAETAKIKSLSFGIEGIEVDLIKPGVSSDTNPNVVIPENVKNTTEETNIINADMEGRFVLRDVAGHDVYTVHYEIAANLDLFDALKKGLKADGSFDPMVIFNNENNELFIDLSHTCGVDCKMEEDGMTSWCAKLGGDDGTTPIGNKLGMLGTQGSIFSIAFAPKQMGSNSAFLSLNPLALLPGANLWPDIKVAGINIKEMLPVVMMFLLNEDDLNSGFNNAHLAASLDPAALLSMLTTTASVLEGEAPAPTPAVDPLKDAILDLVLNIPFNKIPTSGLELNVEKMMTLINIGLDKAGMDAETKTIVSTLIKGMFGDASAAAITVDHADIFHATDGLDIKQRFLSVNSDTKKVFSNGLVDDGTPIVKPGYVLDNDGKVKITADGVSNYDASGKALPMTKFEVEKLFANGTVKYKAVDINGQEKAEATAKVLGVSGLDYNKLDVPQTVTVYTTFTGGLVANLGTAQMIGNIVAPILDTIAGNHFTIEITISSSELKQGSEITPVANNGYSDTKSYFYNNPKTPLDPTMEATVLVGQEKAEKKIQIKPDEFDQYFSTRKNESDQDVLVVNSMNDFKLNYSIGGTVVKTVTVHMGEHDLLTRTEKLEVGESFTAFAIGNPTLQIIDKNDASKQTNTVQFGVYTIPEGTKLTYDASMVKQGDAANVVVDVPKLSPNNLRFKFTQPGTYVIELPIADGLVQKYMISVREKQMKLKFTDATIATIAGQPYEGALPEGYNKGTQITLKPVDKEGQTFKGWKVVGEKELITDVNHVFVMDKDITVKAVYEPTTTPAPAPATLAW